MAAPRARRAVRKYLPPEEGGRVSWSVWAVTWKPGPAVPAYRGLVVKKKGLVILLAVVLLLVVAVMFLPVVLSSSMVLRMALDRVNAASPATISIDSCSIGWKSGLVCRNIRLDDPAAGLKMTIPGLSGSQGLLALLVAPKNLGQIVISRPAIVLTGTRPAGKGGRKGGNRGGTTAGRGEKKDHRATAGAAASRQDGGSAGTPFWEGMRVRLLVQGGTVTSRLHLQPPQVIARDLQLTSGLSDGSIAYSLGLQDGSGKGRLAATGFINLPVRQSGFLDALVSMVNLQINNYDLQGLLATAAGRADALPRGRGDLSGNLTLKTAGLANLTVKGNLKLRELRLNGGFLGNDRPALARVDLQLDADRKKGRDWTLNSLTLTSDAGTIKAKGALAAAGRRLEASGRLKLPVLMAQVPGLLRIRKGVVMKSGQLGFSLDLADRDGTVRVDANTRLEQLGGQIDKRSFAWTTPMTLALKGEAAGGRVKVQDLRLASSFLTITGRGDLDNFFLRARGDLDKGSRELGLLFDLDWRGTGSLVMEATSKALGGNRYVMDLSSTVAGFSLKRAGQEILPPHRLTLALHGSGSPEALTRGRGTMAFRCDVAAWPGTLRLTADNLSRQEGGLTSRYRLNGSLDLARLTDLLHNLEILPRQTTVTGGLDMLAAGFLEQGVVAVRQLDVGVDRLLYLADGFTYRDAHVRLSSVLPAAVAGVPIRVRKLVVSGSPEEFLWTGNGNSAVNPAGRGLYLRNLRLVSGLGVVRIGRLDVADWQRLPETLTTDVRAGLQLDSLARLLHAGGVLDKKLALAGRADLDLRVTQDKGQRLALDLEAPLTLARDGRKILDRERVALTVDARRNTNSEDLVFKKIEFVSRPLTLAASGLLGRERRSVLALKGSVTPDLALLAPIAEAVSGTPLVMKGRHTSQFDLRLPLDLPAEKRARQARLSIDLQADAIRYRGIDLKDLTVPVRMGDGVLETRIHAGLNGGTLAVDPVCRFTAEPPLLSIPDNSRVLTGVQLQRPLVEGVLSRLHPLFGVLARPTGTLDMDLATFSWPLAEKGAEQARFQAVFDVSRVNLDSVGVLREVLALAGLDREKLRLKDSTITCTGAGGRIRCTPVHILVAGSDMVISGSLGMDGTLDYLLQVPVTRNLVGREGYRVLKGTTIKVPVRGTLGQPVFNRQMVTAAVSDLARQAAGKAIKKEVEKALPGLLKGLMGK